MAYYNPKKNYYDNGNFNRSQGVKGKDQRPIVLDAMDEYGITTGNKRTGRNFPIPKGGGRTVVS